MRNIIDSELYQKAVKEVSEKAQISIDYEYEDIIAKYDNNRLIAAELDENDIVELLQSDYSMIVEYAIAKLSKFRDPKIDEEYPKGEEPDPDEEEMEIFGGYGVNFLIMYMMEFYFLKYNPTELLSYLKTVRIPHAQKYEKELKEVYSKSLK